MKLAITTGDPNGIGIEVTAKALRSYHLDPENVILFGPKQLLENSGLGIYQIIDNGDFTIKDQEFGKLSAKAGKNSIKYVVDAITAANEKQIDAIVTAPINKEAIKLAGIDFPGHTELLKHYCGSKKVAMMFYAEEMRIILSTIHVPLADVPRLLTREKLIATLQLGLAGTKMFGIDEPRIAVAGLNPHAGEHGLFGREEIDIIEPVIRKFQSSGADVQGPFPADTLFTANNRQKYDLIVTHYHDQGLTAFKALYFDRAVNITLGLPFVRTSVDHGTAFDIAGQDQASAESMITAIKTAQLLVKNRGQHS